MSNCLWKLKYWPLFQLQNLFNTSQDLKSRVAWYKSIIYQVKILLTGIVLQPDRKKRGISCSCGRSLMSLGLLRSTRGRGEAPSKGNTSTIRIWVTDKFAQMRSGWKLHFLQHLLSLFVDAGIFQSNTNIFVLFVLRQAVFAVCKTTVDEPTRENPHSPFCQLCRRTER